MLSVGFAGAAGPASSGNNAHLCRDLAQTYQSGGGASNLRKFNFYLFDAGASIGVRDRFGNTALNIAARQGQREMIGF